MISKITPVIIVKNGEKHLKDTLLSLKEFENVIVYDNGSTDNTLNIARSYSNVTVIEAPFYGFGPTKNLAASYANTDWILSLDADESISPSLLYSLKKWPTDDQKKVGSVLRKNYFCGKNIKTNGWGNDWLVRLYNKKEHSFSESLVHESIISSNDTRIVKLKGPIIHQAINDVGQMLDKTQHYSELFATSEKAKCLPFGIIILKTLFGFFRSYILKGGILSGWRGYTIAFGEAMGVFYKYTKVYQRALSKRKDEN